MPYSDYPHGTIAARGEEIYHHQLREKNRTKTQRQVFDY